MKLTKSKLRQIIKEELSHILSEGTMVVTKPEEIERAIHSMVRRQGLDDLNTLHADLSGSELILEPSPQLQSPTVIKSPPESVSVLNKSRWYSALIAAGVPEGNIKMGARANKSMAAAYNKVAGRF